tara:strand:+ start:582 stop:1220 length:639 start_codon:yes stop_codon:yes gene_type:complete
MKKKWIIILLIIGIIIVSVILTGPVMSDVEIPKYKIIHAEKNIEIRSYDPMIIAEVKITGEREDAIGDGFQQLADYIFGNNSVQHNIAMSAPVSQQVNQKIAMTAPVQQQLNGFSWNISFIMPFKYNLERLPKPNNEKVVLREILSKQFAVIRFSGTNSDENVKEHEEKLIKYLQAKKITFSGSPKYAFYNPPWTLPSMRRNEVMFEIEQKL